MRNTTETLIHQDNVDGVLDPRKREILRLMGIDVWTERKAEIAAVNGATPLIDAEEKVSIEPQVPVASTPGNADSLTNISVSVANCHRCGLEQTRNKTVFGSGNPQADWLFVGEAPGMHEDQKGQPFVGRAGQLLSRMIAALNYKREEVYIANVLKCRPPNNRDPLPDEINHCEPYLHQQIELISPKVIVALGRISAQALLKSTQTLGRMRGKVYHYGPQNTPLIVTYHPAYLLRNPIDKRKTWEDLLLAQATVNKG